MTDISDESICPLCQQSNRCEVQTLMTCWCLAAKIPAELVTQLPEKARDIGCICQACIKAYYQKKAATVHRTTQ